MRPRRRALSSERGTTTVELAFVLPVLLVALVGAVQFALVHHARNVAATAVQEGARTAAAADGRLLDGALRTRDVLQAGLGRTGEAFGVSVEDRGETVVASATGGYRLFIPWVSGGELPLTVSAEVRREGFRSGP